MRVALNLELHNMDGTVERRRDVVVTVVQGLFELGGRRYRTVRDTLLEEEADGTTTSWVVCEERPSKLSKVAKY